MTTILVAVGLLMMVLGFAAWQIIPRVLATQADAELWKPLPSRSGALVQIHAALPLTIEQVDACLQRATEALIEHGPWERVAVEAGLTTLRVIVNNTESWVDAAGQHVGGQAYYSTIAVDKALGSLCHEMIHVLEFTLDGKVDPSHSLWEKRGFWHVDDAYRDTL